MIHANCRCSNWVAAVNKTRPYGLRSVVWIRDSNTQLQVSSLPSKQSATRKRAFPTVSAPNWDNLIDYTAPEMVKGNVISGIVGGRNVVIGTSGLTDMDYVEIKQLALEQGVEISRRSIRSVRIVG